MAGGISSATARIVIEASTAEAIRSFNQLAVGIKRVDKAAQLAARNQERMAKIAKATSTALLGFAAAGAVAVVSSVRLAARVQTLGVVTVQLGKNVGKSEKQMRALEQSVVSQGITLQSARQSIAMMIQAQVDLARATELARLAQDTAVIANVDSSQAFKRVIAVIQTGNIRMGRTLGLQLSFEQAYKRQAETLGKNVNELTQLEKIQARTNEVISQGKFIAGTYEAAMTTAGKRVLSLNRHVEESRRIFGEAFLPIFVDVVMAVEGSLKQWQALDEFQQRGVSSAALAGIQYAAFAGIMLKVIPAVKLATVALLEMGAAQAVATAGIGLLIAAIGIAVVADAKRRGELKAEAEAIEAVATENKKAGKTFLEYSIALRKVGRETGRTVVTQKKFNELASKLAREKHISRIAAEIQLLNKVIVGISDEEFRLFQTLEGEAADFKAMGLLLAEQETQVKSSIEGIDLLGDAWGDTVEEMDDARDAAIKAFDAIDTGLTGSISKFITLNKLVAAGIKELGAQQVVIEEEAALGFIRPEAAIDIGNLQFVLATQVEEAAGLKTEFEAVMAISKQLETNYRTARDLLIESRVAANELGLEQIIAREAAGDITPYQAILETAKLTRTNYFEAAGILEDIKAGVTDLPEQVRIKFVIEQTAQLAALLGLIGAGQLAEQKATAGGFGDQGSPPTKPRGPGGGGSGATSLARGGTLGPITKVGEQGFEFIIGNQVISHEKSRLLEQLGLRASHFGAGGIVLDPGQGGGGAPGPIGTVTTTTAGGAGGEQTQQAQASQTVSIAAEQQTQAQGAFTSDVTAQVGKQVDEQKRSTEELGGKLDQIVEEMVLLREELPRTFRDAAALEVG